MSFIDAVDLYEFGQLMNEAADASIDWYQSSNVADMHGTAPRDTIASSLIAFVMDGTMEMYNAQGYQRVRTRDYYIPGNPGIQPTDRICRAGEQPSTPTIRVELLPTADTVVCTLIRTGRA